jgi:hypothetical protein
MRVTGGPSPPKVKFCQSQDRGCKKKRPCNVCMANKDQCRYGDNDGLVHRLYAAKSDQDMDFEEDHECLQCVLTKRNCRPGEPCYHCERSKDHTHWCTFRRAGGLTERFATQPFIINKDGFVERDESLPAPRRKKPRPRQSRKQTQKDAEMPSNTTASNEDDTSEPVLAVSLVTTCRQSQLLRLPSSILQINPHAKTRCWN